MARKKSGRKVTKKRAGRKAKKRSLSRDDKFKILHELQRIDVGHLGRPFSGIEYHYSGRSGIANGYEVER